MKKVLTETTKLFTVLCCVFAMFSCKSNCQTCTMEGATDVEVCEDDYDNDPLNVLYNAEIAANEALGFTCE